MRINKINKKLILIIILFFTFGFANAQGTNQKPAAKIKRTSVNKEVQGSVTWVKTDRIAIVYASDDKSDTESEILLPIGKDIKLEHFQSLSQLSAGDTVYIQYEEATEEGPTGKIIKRQAKVIGFVRPAAIKKHFPGERIPAVPEQPAN